MPDFKTVLMDEIRRLARKEAKAILLPMQETIAAQKKTIAELNRRIAALEKIQAPAVAELAAEEAEVSARPKLHRFTPARIMKLRKDLKLTQQQMAALLDVNQFSISHWEQGRNKPRQEQQRRLAQLRSMGKRALNKMLQEKLAGSSGEEAAPEAK